jgi:hypothetical protein
MKNIEILTLIANRQNKTLNDLVYEYLTNDEFKVMADILFANINSRRIPNGLEPVEINFSVISACN